jgi:rare lipoprotein A
MILVLDYRKYLIISSIVLTFGIIMIASFNYIFAQEESAEIRIIKGSENNNRDDLVKILNENSVMDQNLIEVEGVASHYGKRFHNRKTASGERYDMNDYTAAHRSFPFGTILKVTNQTNGNSTLVRINDRGPFIRKRIIDLSHKSATEIAGMGLPKVKLEGFIKNQIEIPENYQDSYFFAYSFANKPMILPEDYLQFKGTYYDFSSAVFAYKTMLASGSIDSADSFIVFDNDTFLSQEDSEIYYIASWKPVLYRKIPVMIAEKVYNNQ